MYAILLVGERAKDVFEVGYLQWCEALFCEAKGKLMAQLLCEGALSALIVSWEWGSHLLTLCVGFARSGLGP
jgi:hypothetical protein